MPTGMVKGDVEGEYLWQHDRSVMVFVPAGPFPMGAADGEPDEQPVHQVELSAYYIDKYEVTWRQWKLSELPYSELPNNREPIPEAPDWGIHDDQPVVEVTWPDTQAYTKWVGKRLPTEAEWEKAARGTDGRRYPWGNAPVSAERAVWRYHPIAKESTAPVDCCPAGASPYGAENMAGNVYEWCHDVYAGDFYARSPAKDPVSLTGGGQRVLRGGAFPLEIEYQHSSYRYRLWPGDRTPYIGFRTVVSLDSKAGPAFRQDTEGNTPPPSH